MSKCSLFSFFGDLFPSNKEHSDMGLSNSIRFDLAQI